MYRFLLALSPVLFLGCGSGDAQPARATDPKNAAVVDRGDRLPTAAEMEKLAKDDPIGFVEACLRRYNREVQGYKGVLEKQERVGGTLNDAEVVTIAFREKPHSALMIWQKGAGLAERSMYVEGENNNKLLARPNGGFARFAVGDIVERDVDSEDARKTSRYTMAQFGMKKATERVLGSLRDGKDSGDLNVEYLGIKKLKEAGDRPCYVLQRVFAKPDEEGIQKAVVSFDTENWLQIGTLLTKENGDLVAAYYFRDLEINPDFKPEQFTRAALKP